MTGFRGFDNSMSTEILDKLDTVYLRLKKTEVQVVAVVKFGVTLLLTDNSTLMCCD